MGKPVLWSQERIIAALQDFYAREGRWPLTMDLACSQGLLPHATTIFRRFGSLAHARRQAGMPGGGLEGRGGPGRGGGWTRGKPREYRSRRTP